VLVGAAGGGREAPVLARRRYRVVAFDLVRPSHLLAEQLQLVRSLDHPAVKVDLRSRAPFAAAVLRWMSFSNVRSSELVLKL
jgi:hypothetical protein